MPVHSADSPVAMTDYYRQILASLTSGVLALDREGTVMTANPAACVHLHISPKVLVPGARFSDIEGAAPFLEILQEMQVTGQPVSRRELSIGSGALTKWIGVTASQLQGPEVFNGAIFLFIDLSEIRQLRRAAELNRQLAQIGELTAGVVHELRNPLSVISGMAELLMRKLGAGNEHERKARVIFEEAAQLERLIGQFLSFARPYEVELSRCSAEEVVDRAVRLCERLATERRVKVTTRFLCDPLSIDADQGKLSLALGNVVRNAIEAVEAGVGEVDMNVAADPHRITIRIEDNGPGIRLAEGEDLFTAFLTKKEGGTGLGLAIVHRIVTAHGGTVTYGNREDGGAWFEVRLPREHQTN